MTNAAPTKSGGALRRWSRRLLGAAVLLTIAGVIAGAWVWNRVRSPPEVWNDHRSYIEQTPAEALDSLAAEVEGRLPSEWTRPIGSGDGVRTIRIHFDEVNAWLAVRMAGYLENQEIDLNDAIGDFMVAERDGLLVLAFDYAKQTGGRDIASLFFRFAEPAADDVGSTPPAARVVLDRMQAGRQKLPRKLITSQLLDLPHGEKPQVEPLLRSLGEGEPIEVPTLPVDAHRRATVLGVDVQPTYIDLTLKVEFTSPASAAR